MGISGRGRGSFICLRETIWRCLISLIISRKLGVLPIIMIIRPMPRRGMPRSMTGPNLKIFKSLLLKITQCIQFLTRRTYPKKPATPTQSSPHSKTTAKNNYKFANPTHSNNSNSPWPPNTKKSPHTCQYSKPANFTNKTSKAECTAGGPGP